jgi:tRNA modification GTPase
MAERSTIFALSSGRPPAAIAVVRVCGPNARAVLEKLIGRVPPPRQAALARVRDPKSGEVIDEALVLWFPAPHSETGEDMAELQLHGGRAIVAAVLEALAAIDGCRIAEPGEFTRRAFENGRLDLTEAEGLADLIAAETQAQRRAAFRQLKGLIGDHAETWRAAIVEALALIEARIDFADEADVPEDLVAPALASAQKLRAAIGAALTDSRRGERLRDGLVAAIAGPPNAGKSTLLNRLARREAAIVSPYPGTTRDVIEVHVDLGGYPLTLLDTAGVRASVDPVEEEGVRRAIERAAAADLVLWVVDASAAAVAASASGKGGTDRKIDDATEIWLVNNKCDLVVDRPRTSCGSLPGPLEPPRPPGEPAQSNGPTKTFFVSAATGSGVGDLLASLSAYARDYFAVAETAVVTRARHRRALEETVAALDRALAEGKSGGAEELIAEDLRAAATALGRLTGRVDVEDILDVIFKDFCIGK